MSMTTTTSEKDDSGLFSISTSRNTKRITQYKGDIPTSEMVREALQNWIALASQKKGYLGDNFVEDNEVVDDELTTLGFILSNTYQILAKETIHNNALVHLYHIFQPNPYIEITDIESIFIVTEHYANDIDVSNLGTSNSKTSYTTLITGLAPELQETALNLELIRYKIVTEDIYVKMNAEEQYFVDELSETHLPAAFDAYNEAKDRTIQGELGSTINSAYKALNELYFKYTQGEKDEAAKNAKTVIDSFLKSNTTEDEYVS